MATATPRKTKPRIKRPGPTAPATPAPPAFAPDVASILSADELRTATTWDLWITPTKRILCRLLNVADVLLMGIVPLHLQQALREDANSVRGEDGLSIKPEYRQVIEDYAVAAALEPRFFNGRTPEGGPRPVPPGAVGVWEVPDGLLLRIFNTGLSRIAEVDPARVETFRRAADAHPDEPALHGEGVRPAAEPVAAPAAARGADWSG